MEQNPSHDVTSKAERIDDMLSYINAQSHEVSSNIIEEASDGLLETKENGARYDIHENGDVTDGLKNMSGKLSSALVNVVAEEDLVKQHAKVAEEAIAGWEKAEKEVKDLKKEVKALTRKNSTLEDQVSHLDSALKECVRQLRQTRDDQEKNIHDGLKKTQEFESVKTKLENQPRELQSKSEPSNAFTSPSSVDFDIRQKVEYLEKENIVLKHELQVQSEKLEIRTIERDLSTHTAEMASKQHLEGINKVAKLEAECRRLKNMACRDSLGSSSFCVKSLIDSQSDSGERTNTMELDSHRKSGSTPDIFELSCSDLWASALIAELDQFKNEKCAQVSTSSVKIDFMDDFLEMERLAGLPDTNQCINEKCSIRGEFDIMNHQMDELKEKVQVEKAELESRLMKSKECIEALQHQMREAEAKLEELQKELRKAYKSQQMLENELMSMKAEGESITAKVLLLEAEVDKEKAMSVEIAMKCKELEEEKIRPAHTVK